MDAYSRALKLKRRTFHSMLEEADDLFGDDSEENQKLDGNERNIDPKLLVSMATSINNIGYLRQRSGEATPDETMAAYKKSLRIKRKILGNDSLSVGKTLNNIGSVYYLKKEFEGALPAYEEALQIMESNLGNDHPDVATVISNMGDVCLAMKKPEESLARYRTALNIRWNAFGEKDPRTMRLLEKIARIEIGDKMPTPRGNLQERQNYDWDESELYDLDLRPISLELRLLKDSIKEDIEQVDLLEKKIAIGMVRDKVKIVKGMRELLEAQERGHASFARLESSMSHESSNREDDMDDILYSPGMFATTTECRDDAQARVQERLAKLRIQKGLDPAGPRLPFMENTNTQDSQDPSPQLDPSQSKFLRSALYATGSQSRTALSSLKPEEIKEKAEDIESALKLKKGIDNLRSSGDIGKTQDDKLNAKHTGKVVTSHPSETMGEKPTVCTNMEDGDEESQSSHEASLEDEIPTNQGEDITMDQATNGTSVSTANNDDDVVDEDPFVHLNTRPSERFPGTKIMYTTWLGEVED
jgi:tetratricopeptide (TPR) repeat protein